MQETARDIGAHVVVPFFERGTLKGEYYNSAVLVSPSGEILTGEMPSGRSATAYRKNALGSYRWADEVNDEKFYFRPGDGFPVFQTEIGRIGILICYDRWYPEAWRMLALQGADIICIPNASSGEASDTFVPMIRMSAAQNVVFAVGVNRAGLESVGETTTPYYGLSCIVDPLGSVLAQSAGPRQGEIVAADLDLTSIVQARTERTMYRDRRAELYSLIAGRNASDLNGGPV